MISAYIKPTNRCNVGCTHCYLPESVRATSYRMTSEILEASAVFLAEMQALTRNPSTAVIWHGGEPLVMAPDWYFTAGEVLDRYLPGHLETMQTSLIPFREDFVALVKERFGGFLGVSVDFSQRQLNGSVAAYHDLFMKKADLARSHGITLSPGMVPSRLDLGREREIVRWFVDREFSSIHLDRYNGYEAEFSDRPNNAEHSRFLIHFLDALLEEMDVHGRAPWVGPIRAGILGVLEGVPGDRWGGNCMSDFVIVEPNGDLNNCPDKSTIEAAFGNVYGGYRRFAGDKLRRKWVRHQQTGHQNDWCLGCENFHFCKTGCPITPNDPALEGGECSGYKSFLSYIRDMASTSKGLDRLRQYIALERDNQGAFSAYDQALEAANASEVACAV